MDTGSADGLLRRFRDTGDPEALGALFDATAPALFRVALRLAHDPASAEDALQETFLDLFDAARDWDAALPALPWLTGVLRNRIQRGRRREARRPDARRLPPPPAPPEPPAAASAAEDRDRARRAMLDLEEPYRSVALLRWQYGLEPAEIAEVRGEPPGTVWSLLSRAKERLEKALTGTNALAVAFLPGAGLEAVRAKVVGSVAVKSAGVGTAVGGGLLVSKKAFVTIAALLICIGLGTTVTMMIPRGGFRGRIVDATGKPVAGAKVTLPGVSPEETVTDADGRYSLGGEGKSGALVVVEAEGLVGRSIMVPAGGVDDVALDRGDLVTGRIVGADGAPVSGARIAILPRTREGHRVYATAVTDAAGRFRCEHVDRDNYHNCVVQAEGHGKLVKDFTPARDGSNSVNLGDMVLPAARRVEGVFFSGRGAPIPDAPFSLRGPLDMGRALQAEGVFENATSDTSGRFRFDGVAPGRYTLANEGGKGVPVVTREIVVGDRDLLDLEIRIDNAGWLRVKVVDEAGAPVPGATVCEDQSGLFTRADANGVAVLENLPPNRRVTVTAQGGAEFRTWKYVDARVPEAVRPDGTEVTLVVARASWIRGVVLDEDGAPLQAATVHCSAAWGDTTGADGVFRLAVPEGAVRDVVARTNPPVPGLLARAKGVKAPIEGLVLRMKRISASETLSFRLLDATGLPVPNLDLQAFAGSVRSVRTDADGRVRIEGLFDEETQFALFLPAREFDDPWPLPGGAALPGAVTLMPDGREVDFRLLPGSEIRGTVVDGDGNPAKGVKVHARRSGRWISVEGIADERGRFRLVVPAGEVLLTVSASQRDSEGKGRSGRLNDVRPGETDLVLRLDEE